MVMLAKLLPYAIGAGVLFGGHVVYSGYYKKVGKERCEAAQAAADKEVEDKLPEVQVKLKDAQDVSDVKVKEIHKTFHTGITQAELKLARAEGLSEGAKEGRREVYDEIKTNGGCLTIAYADDDKLLDQARSVQERLSETGRASFAGAKPEARLSGEP